MTTMVFNDISFHLRSRPMKKVIYDFSVHSSSVVEPQMTLLWRQQRLGTVKEEELEERGGEHGSKACEDTGANL